MRWLCLTSLTLGSLLNLGCAMCCSPHDLEYATYGTKTPRLDQQRGRVGSPFSDPELMGQPNAEVIYEDSSFEPIPEAMEVVPGIEFEPEPMPHH